MGRERLSAFSLESESEAYNESPMFQVICVLDYQIVYNSLDSRKIYKSFKNHCIKKPPKLTELQVLTPSRSQQLEEATTINNKI